MTETIAKRRPTPAERRSFTFVRMWRVLVLLRHRPHTLLELADKLSVSVRTIRRDLAALQRVPLPVESRFPTRAGVRAIERNEWFVRAMPEWPDDARTPVADVQPPDGEARP